ncbi:TM0106 family RecB-like putative nuclease [Williamsia sp. CHRR-6]|nr:TM0106 family RecB-like putative nuclease [Williamsia sp. CHRR-6]
MRAYAPVLLSARELAGCEHRVALDHGAAAIAPGAVARDGEDPSVVRRKEAAAAHRERVRELVTTTADGHVRIEAATTQARVDATVHALEAGAARIWNAMLPADRVAGRRGGSELLIRVDDGYVPVIVVNHRVSEPAAAGNAERPVAEQRFVLSSPLHTWAPARDTTRALRNHRRDLLRLGHLQRLLAVAGHGSACGLGGVIGLDADCVVVHDLVACADSYDETFARRGAIAAGQVPTRPSRVGECRSCAWWPVCERQLVAARDVSLVLGGGQVTGARLAGLDTVDALAAHTGPPPDEWSDGVFADAVVLARAWLRDVPLVRRVVAPEITRADIEVDVDMESFGEDGAYLWGTLLTDTTDPTRPVRYRPFVTWDPLPTVDEARSFAQFWAWLSAERAAAHAAGRTFAAYCYSQQAENRWLLGSARRFHGIAGVPTESEVQAFIDSPEWVDVYEAVGDAFICPKGKGLKKIAPVAGFDWRDSEAGGEASMDWYRLAVGLDGTMIDATQRDRLLRYNEDDVWATKVLREWMSSSAVTDVPHVDDV